MLSPETETVTQARARIGQYIRRTPLLRSALLESWLGHEIWFKAECFQRIGAFKARGAMNAVVALEERGERPAEIVTVSSGNHAQAVAWAGRERGIPVTVFLPASSSPIKRQAAESYGARIVLTKTRQDAEAAANERASRGAYLLHPYDDDLVIAGQGTACLEALQEVRPTAVFAPCGGGGLLSGTRLAVERLAPGTPVFAGEPALADDAARSYRSGAIVSLADTPLTIADGVRTLAVSERTFAYLKTLAGFFEVSEEDILYWTQWLTHLLKCVLEPTSAVAMAAAAQWLAGQRSKQRVLVILSGGNIAPETQREIWATSRLDRLPGTPSATGTRSPPVR